MRLTAKEAARLKLNLTGEAEPAGNGTQKPRTASVAHEAENEAYTLKRPSEATHRLKRGIGTWFTNPPLKGSWARVSEALPNGRVSLYLWNNDGGNTLLDLPQKRFREWFERVEE